MRKIAVFLFLCVLSLSSAFAQSRVTGKVVDPNGDPLAGVAVFVKGTTNGTTSAVDGTYSLTVKEDARLVFNCLGFEEAEVLVGTKSVINVTLTEDVKTLESVLVTGYQTISKERATGSFDIVSKAQIEKPSGNIADRIIGAATGLAYSEDIYGNPTFQIRGISTFAASAPPLIVIDGFPVESTFESINPNDVESITVLKDAAAASIWGAKSANGVIVITTKNAKATTSDVPVINVEYSAFYKVSPKIDLDYTLSEASVNDIIDYEVKYFDKYWSNGRVPDDQTYSVTPRTSVYNILTDKFHGRISASEAESRINALRQNNNYDQVRDYLLQNASTHQQNVNLNIGTKRSQTYISLLYQDDDKIYKNRDSKKYNLSFRNKTNIFKWLDFNVAATYNYVKKNNSGYGLSGMAPYEMLADESGNLIRYYKSYPKAYLDANLPSQEIYDGELLGFPYNDWTFNPVEEGEARSFNTYTSMARFQGGLTFKVIEGLTIDAKAQYERIASRTHNYYSDQTYEVRTTVNTAASWNKEDNSVVANLPSGGFLDQSSYETSILTLRTQANFNRTFANKHAIAAVAGIETTDNVTQSFGYPRTYGYSEEKLSVGALANGVGGSGIYQLKDWQGGSESFDYLNTFGYTTDRYFSAFANASYTYDKKYTASASIRTDASNLITDDPKYRYAPFWSVGASWQMGREEFMSNLDWVDGLLLRATYGHNGNVDKTTSFQPLLAPNPVPSILTGENMLGPNGMNPISSYGNPTLRWERTRTFDLGVDYNLLGGKLHGKIDVYNRHSYDLIAKVTLTKVMGTSSISLNNGEISNKGFEFEIGSTLPISRKVVWDGTLMFSYNKNEILSLKQKPTNAYALVYTSNSTPSSNWLEGYDMNTLWTYTYGGVENKGTEESPNMQPVILAKDGSTQTINAWPTGEAIDVSYAMGTKVAPVNIAFNTSLKVYDFDISMILTGKFGHKFLRESFNYPMVDSGTIPNAKLSEVLNADPSEMITLPMNDNDTGVTMWDRFYPYMNYLVANASFIRFQELSVAYNLPKAYTDWLGIGGVKFYVQANNPFNIYFNEWNEDPEFRRGTERLLSSYLFGVKCNF
ncbi:MAG: SusC/RagA family TonB-linked outer membrane protein [Bacteroidales bacterium]|nr:SusC/RagA family TonB-linked outer membrane protein [Bacteroidales bacterium]